MKLLKKLAVWFGIIFIAIPLAIALIFGSKQDEALKTKVDRPNLTTEQIATREENIKKTLELAKQNKIEEEKKIEDKKIADEKLAIEKKANESLWKYDQDVDSMRNEKTKYAGLFSNNSIDMGFPYNNTTMQLTLRNKGNGKDIDVIFTTKSQFKCHYGECSLDVKFDDGKIEKWSYSSSNDGSTNNIFINNSKKFIEKVKNSKELTVEAIMFHYGSAQFNFTTKNLKFE
jgi:hypothetical protein